MSDDLRFFIRSGDAAVLLVCCVVIVLMATGALK